MSVELGLAVVGSAVNEAATLVAEALGLEARPGEGFDLWGGEGDNPSEAVPSGAVVWSAELVGESGGGGEMVLALPAEVPAPEESAIASALALGAAALNGAVGADRVGEITRSGTEVLTAPRAGQRALAVPLLLGAAAAAGGGHAGLLAVIMPAGEAVAELPHLDPSPGPSVGRSIATFGDVEMSVSVELGRTKIPIRDLLNIHSGAVVQLDRPVTHPVDLFVQGTLIARGEVVVVDECFAVRVTELLTGD